MEIQTVLIVILLIVVAICLSLRTNVTFSGGSEHNHIVIDTLNATGYLFGEINKKTVVESIKKISKQLKQKYKDRIVFVVKMRDGEDKIAEYEETYKALAKEEHIFIYLVEQYTGDELPQIAKKKSDLHSGKGRDDLMAIILANQLKCSILTNDKYRDLKEFKNTVPGFYAYEFNYFSMFPERHYMNPAAIKYLKRPKTIQLKELIH